MSTQERAIASAAAAATGDAGALLEELTRHLEQYRNGQALRE